MPIKKSSKSNKPTKKNLQTKVQIKTKTKTKTKKIMQTSITKDISKNFELQKELEQKIKNLQNEIAQEQAKNKTAEIEIADWKNKSLRIAAELQNSQKQQELDIAQSQKRAKKITVDSIFSFLNTLNISFNFRPQTDDQNINNFIQTLEVSYKQVLKELQSIGIEIIQVQTGDSFDPEFMTILNDTRKDSSPAEIKQVVSIGIKIDGQIIQPASVIL